jgi:hypothetical protein
MRGAFVICVDFCAFFKFLRLHYPSMGVRLAEQSRRNMNTENKLSLRENKLSLRDYLCRRKVLVIVELT